jgi:hypothetical protein
MRRRICLIKIRLLLLRRALARLKPGRTGSIWGRSLYAMWCPIGLINNQRLSLLSRILLQLKMDRTDSTWGRSLYAMRRRIGPHPQAESCLNTGGSGFLPAPARPLSFVNGQSLACDLRPGGVELPIKFSPEDCNEKLLQLYYRYLLYRPL